MNDSLKKTLGVIVIVVALLFAIISLSPLIAYLTGSGDREIEQVFIEVIFIGVLSVLGFNYGLKLYRAGKRQVPPPGLVEVDPAESIQIDVQIPKKEFIKLNFWLVYSKPFMIYLTLIGVLNLAALINNYQGFNASAFFVLVVLLMPGIIYFLANKNYNTQKIIKEKISYEFNKDNIIQNGETFSSTIKWSSLHKVKETSKWYLLYTNPMSAYFITKKSFISEDQEDKFLSMAWSAEGVRKELKLKKVA